MDIDMVYLWVDGSDPKWVEKRNACIGKPTDELENCKGRYADNDELKYSLRSVEKYAPWIRKIFIVTDNQIPKWLDTTNPKIRIVDHTEIMPPESLPCFNSTALEHQFHKIPGLSEYFIYANDDMFINKPVTPETFFGKDNFPIIRQNYKFCRKYFVWFKLNVLGQTINSYARIIHNSALLVEKKFGKYYSGRSHHNIDAFIKSGYVFTRQLFDEELKATVRNHKRSENDIHRHIYPYMALATNCGHLRYVTQHTSFRLPIHKRELYKKLLKYKPILFCMNDSQFSNDDDREYAKAFLSEYFPEKSQFEK